MFCRSLFVLLYFLFWPLCCLFFFYIRIRITPLVSSNSSSHRLLQGLTIWVTPCECLIRNKNCLPSRTLEHFGGVRVDHPFCFLISVPWFVCLRSVSCVQCCLCLSIAHSWMPLRFSLTFICVGWYFTNMWILWWEVLTHNTTLLYFNSEAPNWSLFT
jgi:hypothetical protein